MTEQTQSQADLITFYTRSVRKADYLQREMERQAANLFADELRPVVANGRDVYRAFTNRLQTAFVRHLEQAGWPPPAYTPTTQLFDRFVRPKLAANGQRVALLLIDALRYELGVELEKRLSKLGQSEIGVACAPLPTVTPLGMAALLPDADSKLSLLRKQNRMAVQYEDQLLSTVGQRVGVLNRLYGERVADVKLNDLARGMADIPATVDLLLVRSNDMDQAFESNPDTGFAQIRTTLSQVLQAVKRLAELGFHDVVILTDHGFALNPDVAAGDVGEKPSGNWVNVHERLLLGDGTADNNNWVLPAEMLGMRGEFNQAAGPRALVAYRAGETYLHGGASLPETVVPYLLLTLKTADSQVDERPTVTLSYKRKRITTQRPAIEVAIGPASSLFGVSNEIELLIEAHDAQGKVVGQVQGGDGFDEMTGTVRLRPGATGKITLGMSRTFEGPFTVKALDPTLLTTYDTLSLQTDYMVL